MPSITALRATIQTILQIDTAYDLSVGSETDRILAGANLPLIAKCLTFGTGAGKAGAAYYERLTFANGNTDLDLLALATNRGPVGNRGFDDIKYALLRIVTPAAGAYLLIGNYGANGWVGPLGDNASPYEVRSKWEDVNEIDGWLVNSSHRFLRVNNPSESDIVADLILVGETSAISPLTLSLSPSAGQIVLSWTVEDAASSYKVYRGDSSGAETLLVSGLPTSAYTDTDVDDGTTYFYEVSAVVGGVETPRSNEVSGTTAPAAPTSLAAFGGTGGAYIQWDESVGSVTYDLQYSDDNSDWHNLSLVQTDTFYPDSVGHPYYRVRGTNVAALSSAYTNAVASGSPLSSTLFGGRSVNGFTPSQWSDVFGPGNHATQGTSGNQAALAAGVLGGKSVVRLADANRLYNLPAIIPTAGTYTLVALFRSSDLTAHNNIFCGTQSDFSVDLTLGAGSDLLLNLLGTSTNPTLLHGGSVGSPQTAWALAVVPILLTPNPNFGSGGDTYNSQMYLNNTLVGFAQTPQPAHATQPTVSIGGIQGTPGFGYIGDFAELMVTSTQPTAAEMNNLANMINATYGLAVRRFSKQNLFIGDSLTNGGKASNSGGCWAFLVAASDVNRYSINQGYPGGMCSDLIAAASTALYPYTSCGVDTTCTIMFGANDLVLGKTGAQVYADIQTLVTGLRAHGNPKIVVCTMLPRDDGGFETQRQALNNALRANHSFADGFFDVETVPAIGAAGAANDLTYYDADKLHLNDTGHAAFYTGLAPVLVSVW